MAKLEPKSGSPQPKCSQGAPPKLTRPDTVLCVNASTERTQALPEPFWSGRRPLLGTALKLLPSQVPHVQLNSFSGVTSKSSSNTAANRTSPPLRSVTCNVPGTLPWLKSATVVSVRFDVTGGGVA